MSSEEGIMGPDKYRVFLHLEAPTVQWKRGRPSYEAVNKLFEDGRTKVSLFLSPFHELISVA